MGRAQAGVDPQNDMAAEHPIIHVIDNDEAVRDALGELLGSVGFDVRIYESPLPFLEQVRPRAGCVVTDVQMPQMSGLDLLRRLKAEQSPLPVIIMTGRGGAARRAEAIQAGAADFIEKPFDEDVMLAAIRRVLNPVAQTASA
jgi:two-component system response regulator FixJ